MDKGFKQVVWALDSVEILLTNAGLHEERFPWRCFAPALGGHSVFSLGLQAASLAMFGY